MYVDGVIDGTRTRAQCPPSPHSVPSELRGGTATHKHLVLPKHQKSLLGVCPQHSRRRRGAIISLMYYSYILLLSDNTYYTGFSSDLKTRIKDHQIGNVPQTRNLRPLKLIYYSAFSTKKLALDFEKYLKSHSGFAFRNKRLI